MKQETRLHILLIFTIAYLIVASVLAFINKNYEFLYYMIVMCVLMSIVLLYHKRFHLQNSIMVGLSLVGAMHVFGGTIRIGQTRLYDLWLIEGWLKYDHMVHLVGIFVATLVAYNLLYPHLDKKLEHNPVLISLLLVFVASGIGAFSEILELGAVLYLNAAQQVGDYFNNAFDLVFNLLGSLFACIILICHHWRHK